MHKAARLINSMFWLGLGVLLLILFTSSFMVGFILPTGYVLISGGPHDYIKSVWLGFDRLWNAILMGDDKETFSSRLGKIWWHNAPTRMPNWFSWRLLRLLDVIDPNHCRDSIDWSHGWQIMEREKIAA